MEFPARKNTSKMKNYEGGIKRRLKVANGKVTELEDIAIEMTQKRKKMTDRNEQHFCGIK